jgi:16S rRNA (guanine527-N7)-methyltransferase
MFHVKQHLLLHDLIHFLKTQNITLSPTQVQQLELYHTELQIFTDKMNLISARDKAFIIEHHFLPSFYYSHYLKNDNDLLNKHILDLGTGAGFPGIILAITFPYTDITLIDSSRKKTLFLKNLVSKTNLNVNVICDRIENLTNTFFNKYDIIVARAVSSIPVLCNWALPYLQRDGYLLTLKGDNYKQELGKKKDIKLIELMPDQDWCDFSGYLHNKRMIKIFNN